ncbi:MAG: antibiotic biosynthesis monooxygenase [Betaproteobacteria bacterium]|nr:MAG: antibiotic biosynthesis monooxygenase [Betaproteobacteria bacterium]
MFVVTVLFEPRPEHATAFRGAMIENARASREREPGCRRFDVCADPASGAIFLYELYADRAAFDAHLATPHFRAFDAATRDWVARKDVRTYERVDP